MAGVIGKIVAAICVSEDGEIAPVQHEPLRDFAELIHRDGQLTAATRMRTDRDQMIAAYRHSKLLVRSRAERLRLVQLVGIEVDVGVEIADHHCTHRGN